MKTLFNLSLFIVLATVALRIPYVDAKVNSIELVQKSGENQIRHLIEPLLDKYCHDQCKLMNVNISVDLATPDEFSPGFEDVDSKLTNQLAPSQARIKILIDDKVGPISRTKLLELIQQYLDSLDFPVKVDSQVTHFPLPQGSEGKIIDLRDRISKQFINTTEELLRQFCPQTCLLADYNLQTEVVNGEEAQYGSQGEFIQEGDTVVKIKEISATLLMDEDLSPDEQKNILEMVRLKTTFFKHVTLTGRSMRFPHPTAVNPPVGLGPGATRSIASDLQKAASTDSKFDSKNNSKSESKVDSRSNLDSRSVNNSTNSNAESNSKQEHFERFEKIERVENGDAVQAELRTFKIFGLIFASSVIALLLLIMATGFRINRGNSGSLHKIIQTMGSDTTSEDSPPATLQRNPESQAAPTRDLISKRYEIERLIEELTAVFAQQPRVAKQVFSRIITEEGIEVTSAYIHIFGEAIVVDMLRDPSLQSDVSELMEFYAKNIFQLTDDERLDLLRKLHNRTIAGKLFVMGNRSSNLFDFLAEMDGLQILELIRTETMTVKSIVLTQCDPQKRSILYSQLDPDIRMNLLAELSRIDYLPRDFIFNVASALKRKRKENPKLNTEALPGSEVLVSLLERTGQALQKTVVKNLELSNPDSARTIKTKLVSIDTLRYLRDGQLLEVVLSLKHDELVNFLKGAPEEIRSTVYSKAPQELVMDLEEEIIQVKALSREVYHAIERKLLNRIKVMAGEGHINLIETNERMFSESPIDSSYLQTSPPPGGPPEVPEGTQTSPGIKKVLGW